MNVHFGVLITKELDNFKKMKTVKHRKYQEKKRKYLYLVDEIILRVFF